MPSVSVIIPAFNAGKFLAPTIESALQSSFDDIEIVVIDDGSTDNTAEVAGSFGGKVRVISQANAGMSASRNAGIESGDSEFIALLDADDIWHPEKIANQVAALTENPEADFVFTEFTSWDGQSNIEFPDDSRLSEVEPELSGWIYHKMVLTNWALPSSVLFRRSAWKNLGPFLCDNHKTDDWEYFVRASVQHQFIKLKGSMVLYRQHPTSLSKRVAGENETELMRESLISRFGYKSPDGTEVDRQELDRRRHKGWCDFASLHCSAGKFSTGTKAFLKTIASGPKRKETVMRFAKSSVRRFIPAGSA